MLAFCMQFGGGLAVWSGGTANLEGCNIFDNVAQVRARLLPLPGPFLQRPAGTLRMCLPSIQIGAGLYIEGMATLTDTNVYSNVAEVSEPAYLSSSAPLERYTCSLSACRVTGVGSSSMARPR